MHVLTTAASCAILMAALSVSPVRRALPNLSLTPPLRTCNCTSYKPSYLHDICLFRLATIDQSHFNQYLRRDSSSIEKQIGTKGVNWPFISKPLLRIPSVGPRNNPSNHSSVMQDIFPILLGSTPLGTILWLKCAPLMVTLHIFTTKFTGKLHNHEIPIIDGYSHTSPASELKLSDITDLIPVGFSISARRALDTGSFHTLLPNQR
jgi:hypothetical protein